MGVENSVLEICDSFVGVDIPFQPIITGLLGALMAHVLIRWLGLRFPVKPKLRSLEWYKRKYSWVEFASVVAFFAGLAIGIILYATIVPRNDPRGAAVGFAIGCILAFSVTLVTTLPSRDRSLREFWDYSELKYEASHRILLYLVIPVFAVSVYGSIHLLIYGI